MTDQPEQSAEEVASAPTVQFIEGGFPPANIATVFADGILNAAPSASVVKFYLYRTDPDQGGAAKFKNQVFAQVVMPLTGFIQAAVFFERVIKQFTSTGVIPESIVNDIRNREEL